MATNPALTMYPQTWREVISQTGATTGRTPTPEEAGQFALADVYSRYYLAPQEQQLALQAQSQTEQTRQFDVTTALKEEEMKKQQQAAMVSGIGQLGMTGLLTYGMGKQAGWWGGQQALGGGAQALSTGATTPALTGAGMVGETGMTAAEMAAAGASPEAIAEYGGAAAGTSALTTGLYGAAGAIGGGLIGQELGGKTGATFGSTIGGGIAAGAAIGGLPGAVIGGVIGAAVGGIEEIFGCIIITACTNRNSYEVNICRQYRDKYMTMEHLRGYYALAEQIVPYLKEHEKARRWTKKHLVDHLVDYIEYRLGFKETRPTIVSYIVFKGFMGLCKTIGLILPQFVRANGEVY